MTIELTEKQQVLLSRLLKTEINNVTNSAYINAEELNKEYIKELETLHSLVSPTHLKY